MAAVVTLRIAQRRPGAGDVNVDAERRGRSRVGGGVTGAAADRWRRKCWNCHARRRSSNRQRIVHQFDGQIRQLLLEGRGRGCAGRSGTAGVADGVGVRSGRCARCGWRPLCGNCCEVARPFECWRCGLHLRRGEDAESGDDAGPEGAFAVGRLSWRRCRRGGTAGRNAHRFRYASQRRARTAARGCLGSGGNLSGSCSRRPDSIGAGAGAAGVAPAGGLRRRREWLADALVSPRGPTFPPRSCHPFEPAHLAQKPPTVLPDRAALQAVDADSVGMSAVSGRASGAAAGGSHRRASRQVQQITMRKQILTGIQ